MNIVAGASQFNPRFSSHHLCLEIAIGPFPAGTRKTPSLGSLTGYCCVFHRPDPFTAATHVNWRSYEQPAAQWDAGSDGNATKGPVSTKAAPVIRCGCSICWQQRFGTPGRAAGERSPKGAASESRSWDTSLSQGARMHAAGAKKTGWSRGIYPIYNFHNKLMVEGVSGWMGVKEQSLLQLPAYP